MKRIVNIAIWVIMVFGLIAMLAFVEVEQGTLKCSSLHIDINHDDGNYFVEKSDVESIIYNTGDSVINQPISKIKIDYLEKLINNHPAIADAQVYKSIDGQLHVKVQQRFPIVRVFNAKNESYYIDQQGGFMPLSDKYAARVIVANGHIFAGSEMFNKINVTDLMRADSVAKKTNIDDVYLLAKYINDDNWRKAQFQQIYIDERGDIELIPNVGDHRIILGDLSDLDEKMEKLKVFYLEGLSKTGWNEYKTINLKYKNQVVCTKI